MEVKYCIYPTLLDSFYWYKCFGGDKFRELIDKINRVKYPIGGPAKRGIDFEDSVNKRLKNQVDYKEFKPELVEKIAYKLSNSVKQQEYIEGIIDSDYGKVKMYGIIDYSYPHLYVDLKTCGKYKKGKFENYSQHKAYPLLNQLNGGSVNSFTYLVTDFSDVYNETYDLNQKMIDKLLIDTCEFIEFLEANRNLITDKKIFNG